jgi:hypothetical protein
MLKRIGFESPLPSLFVRQACEHVFDAAIWPHLLDRAA